MHKRKRPVLDAITTLKKVEGHATASSIARFTGLKYRDVVLVLEANADLLRRSDKYKSRILGTHREYVVRRISEKQGNIYGTQLYNYGSGEEIWINPAEGTAFPDEILVLQKDVWCGGFGDSYKKTVIEATDENIQKVRDAGYVKLNEYMIEHWDELDPWVEPLTL